MRLNTTISSAIGFESNTSQKSFKDINGITFAEFSRLNKKDQARIEGAQGYALTGYTKDQKVSIWGKLMGYDHNFGADKIDELKKFINDSGGLAIEHLPALNKSGFSNNKLKFARDDFFSVDEFVKNFNPSVASAIFNNSKSISLLDSDLSIDDFKVKWAQHTLKERFGLTLKDDDANKALAVLKELKEQQSDQNNTDKSKNKFTPLQVIKNSTTYKDEVTSKLQKFYELIKREFDSGKNTFNVLKTVAENKIDLKV